MELADHLKEIGTLLEYSKGDVVFSQGETCSYLYLVKKGLLKGYYLTASGKEYVKTFVQESEFIGDLSAYHVPEDGYSFTLECLEPTTLLRLKFSDVIEFAKQEPAISIVIIEVLLGVINKKQRREFEFLCLSPEERYTRIKDRNPGLLDRATQNDIARYLGITPVALSRIRGRIMAKQKS